MNITPLKYILFIENVLTVFRNYLCLKKCTRIIALCWVIITTSNLIHDAAVSYSDVKNSQIHPEQIYYFSSIGFSIYLIIATLYYSKRFYKVLLNFDAFYKIFDDEVYKQKMLKLQKRLTFMIVLFCGTQIFIFTFVRVHYSGRTTNLIFFIITVYNYSTSDFRYIFQYFLLSSIFLVICEQLQGITRLIDNELSAIKKNKRNVEHAEESSSVPFNLNKFNKWVKAYENVNNSSNLCNSMFGVQLAIMLLIVTTYYIILMYTIATMTVKGVRTLSPLLTNLYAMVVFLMALFVLSYCGQKIQKSYLKLQQKLCEFCMFTIENEEYYKLARDLLRCVRTRPVRVHLFGALDVNMSMLPSIVAFFTSYTVVALQFNNVL